MNRSGGWWKHFPIIRFRLYSDLGWRHLQDHVLLQELECDVFVTADRGFEHQHNLRLLRFGIVVVHVSRNKIDLYRPLFPQLVQAVETIRPGAVVHVYAPHRD